MLLKEVVARYGAAASQKLSNPAATGEPEDQLRAPMEALVRDLAGLCGFPSGTVVCVGESALSELKTQPDYAVTVRDALTGFMELKAPGKGADPNRFREKHDREQWGKLQSLPNLVYTDGQEFALWRSGELVGQVVRLEGDIQSAGASLLAQPKLLALFEDFLRWEPVAPRTVKQLAELTARLCRLLRDEVTEEMERGSEALTELATDWRRLLFPEATDAQFADGYAQAVTFGLLVARARGLALKDGIDVVARKLGRTDSLIGTALRILTDSTAEEQTLQTSISTLVRVLDVVEWSVISRGNTDAWLYFYETFLEVYDNTLRKQTGSYYTPPEVVEAMVRLVDETIRTRFGFPRGLASERVTIADPAVGTGTYILGVLRRIASLVEEMEGGGAVPGAVQDALSRIVAFELQLGPFAVAQLRIVAEIVELAGDAPRTPLRMFVTNSLGNPWAEQESLGAVYEPIAESRRQANAVKRNEPITVVIGNPPYKEKAKGLGGWVEAGGENHPAPLLEWMPPREWGVGAHAKHLRNLYVYFWRWGTWKVFDSDPSVSHGIVSFISVAGFLSGPGFQKMRDWLRRTTDEIWVIDCSPEGYQAEVATRIFQGVQQPVCIVMASRSPATDREVPATVRYRSLPEGRREVKFEALGEVALDGPGWVDCSADWRAPFLPELVGAWADYIPLEAFFDYNGSGVMPGRVWVIAPDAESLVRRWEALQQAPADRKENLFHPHLRRGEPGDRHVTKTFGKGMPGWAYRTVSVAADSEEVLPPVRYAFRSLDRQWIIPDYRLINQPNPALWGAWSEQQVYLTALERVSPTSGPAVTFAGAIPDLHHYKGSFGGRAYPLWADAGARTPNIVGPVIAVLTDILGFMVKAEDVMAYLAAVGAHPAYTARFQEDLKQPGLRIPLTADPGLFAEAVELGRRVIWLHTYGERCVDAAAGRPLGPPRVDASDAPRYPREGAIPSDPEGMPDALGYDPGARRLHVGKGYIDNVPPEVWAYEVSGKSVLVHWFSYRRRDRSRPIIGDRRAPSPLEDIQPDYWLASYTSDLIDLLHVLRGLVALEPKQAALLDRICAGPLLSAQGVQELPADGGRRAKGRARGKTSDPRQVHLLDGE